MVSDVAEGSTPGDGSGRLQTCRALMSSRVSNFPSDVGAVEAVLSLEFVVALTLISRFKYDKLWMTIDFLAFLMVYRDISAFLLAMFPTLRWWILAFAVATLAAIIVAWRLDHYRARLQAGLAGFSISAMALAAASLSCPTDLRKEFVGGSYVSKFARTGVEAIQELGSHGYLEAARRRRRPD